MFVAIAIRFQLIVASDVATEEIANAQQQLERAGFLVDRFQPGEQLLEFAIDVAAYDTARESGGNNPEWVIGYVQLLDSNYG